MFDRANLHARLSHLRWGQLDVTYPDGDTVRYGTSPPIGRMIIHDASAIKAMVHDLDLGFGEAYMDGRIDFEGDVHDLVTCATRNLGRPRHPDSHATSMRQQREDIHRHYDLGNDFFRLFLDPAMTYSCAYFQHADDSLALAQSQKVDHSLRKLRLRPGETLLDIGCGWGQLAIRAASHHGVQVDGITLSTEQRDEARRRIAHHGLENRVRIELLDYRTVVGRYDKIVSIGMLEHVGHANLPVYLDRVQQLLRPGGLALLHGITSFREQGTSAWILKYIFPGGYTPSLRELVGLMPDRGFHVLDVENLGPHYALTLDRWSENFERNKDQVRAMLAKHTEAEVERFIRMWRLYLRGAAAGFRIGANELHQILISSGLSHEIPLTRADVYGIPTHAEQPLPRWVEVEK